MPVRVIVADDDTLRAWQQAALDAVGAATLAALERREAERCLSGEEADALATCRGLAWLLGEDPDRP